MKAIRFNASVQVECMYADDSQTSYQYQSKALLALTNMDELIAWLTHPAVQAPDFSMSGFGYGRNHHATILMQVEKRGSRYMVSRYTDKGGFRGRDFVGPEDLPALMDEIKNQLFSTK